MADFINTVDVVGDVALTDSIINKTVTEYADNLVTVIGERAFYNCTVLTSIDAPTALSVGNYSFGNCTTLVSANLPSATTFGTYAFNYSALTEIDFSAVINIGQNCFAYCSSLTTASFTNATTVGSSAFSSCTSLVSVNLPVLQKLQSSCFNGCSKLAKGIFPAVTDIGGSAFNACMKLEFLDFPILTSISGSSVFWNCKALATLVLRSKTMVTLNNANSFTYTPIASGTGYIYVPEALVDSYKAATNWSTYANQFRALEDYTVDGTITGELDESKI